MIYVKIESYYINSSHIILIAPREMGDATNGETVLGSRVIYGFSKYTESIYSIKSPEDLIEDIRKQIINQLKNNPELGRMQEVNRFELMDMEG